MFSKIRLSDIQITDTSMNQCHSEPLVESVAADTTGGNDASSKVNQIFKIIIANVFN